MRPEKPRVPRPTGLSVLIHFAIVLFAIAAGIGLPGLFLYLWSEGL